MELLDSASDMLFRGSGYVPSNVVEPKCVHKYLDVVSNALQDINLKSNQKKNPFFRFFEVEVGLYLFLFYDLCNCLRLTFILNICFMQIGSGYTRFVNKRLLSLGWALVV